MLTFSLPLEITIRIIVSIRFKTNGGGYLKWADETIIGWLARTAAQYGLCAIETKWPANQQDLTPMTDEHLLECHPAVQLQYVEVADRYPSVVPSEVMGTVRELTEHGTRPSRPTS